MFLGDRKNRSPHLTCLPSSPLNYLVLIHESTEEDNQTYFTTFGTDTLNIIGP